MAFLLAYADTVDMGSGGFWDRVKQVLAGKGYAELIDSLGVSQSTFSTWVTKDRMPRGDEAFYIAKALGVTVEFLVDGTSTTDVATSERPIAFGVPEEIYNLVRQLGPSEQTRVLAYAQGILDSRRSRKESAG